MLSEGLFNGIMGGAIEARPFNEMHKSQMLSLLTLSSQCSVLPYVDLHLCNCATR